MFPKFVSLAPTTSRQLWQNHPTLPAFACPSLTLSPLLFPSSTNVRHQTLSHSSDPTQTTLKSITPTPTSFVVYGQHSYDKQRGGCLKNDLTRGRQAIPTTRKGRKQEAAPRHPHNARTSWHLLLNSRKDMI